MLHTRISPARQKDGNTLVLSSGSRGKGSSVRVYADGTDGLAAALKLITGGVVKTDGFFEYLSCEW